MRAPLATYSVILAEVAAFALTYSVASPNVTYSVLGFSSYGLAHQFQSWTLVTSLFIHVNVYHLGINMFFLYVFGAALESGKGSKPLLIVFFIGGILPLLIGIPLYPPDTRIVGSSIAVSAVIGAVLVTMPNKPSPIFLFNAPLGLVATIYLIFNVFFAFYGQTALGIAYPSHVIGFIVGAGISLLVDSRMIPRESRHNVSAIT